MQTAQYENVYVYGKIYLNSLTSICEVSNVKLTVKINLTATV